MLGTVSHSRPRAIAALAVLLFSGCFHAGVTPRTGDVLPAGAVAGGVTVSLGTFAPGKFGGSSGNSGQRGPVSPMAIMGFYMQNAQGFLRVGVADRWELEMSLGAQEFALGTRAGIWQEDDGDDVSVALAGAAYYRPTWWGDADVFRADTFGARLGFDTSRRLGDVAIVWNPAVSFGPESHAAEMEYDTPCGGFGGEGCGEYGPSAYAFVMRRELRVHSAIGIAIPLTMPDTDAPTQLVLGAVPYLNAWTSDPLENTCLACDDASHRDLVEDWGVHFVARLEAGHVGRERPPE